jgi:small neutral amino acid transporter SnatA (MarC family)
MIDFWVSNNTYLFYNYITLVFIYLSIILNIIIFYDLNASITNPFKKRERRMIYYKAIVSVFVVISFSGYFYFPENDLFIFLGIIWV